MGQLPAPRNPMTEEGTYDLLTGAERQRARVGTDHGDAVATLLEEELAVAVDDAHVSLRAPRHVAEGVARAQQEAPQPRQLQRQCLGDVDSESLAPVLED